ncbi:ABC transporter ATP-binding protein, partial [Candidatus Acetothermia bacterium]|nr:ABC transporter ATP-binding protein [Candidatus Acetothermia bacterium]
MIETQGLTKRYDAATALDSVTMKVPEGSIGLLGENGAGKTTLIKLLLGLLKPTQGSARVLGMDITRQSLELRRRVGYMPEDDCLPLDVTGMDFVSRMGMISGLPKTAAVQRTHDVLYLVGIGEERFRPLGTYSTGMKQKVKLAQALVHDPKLVLLDEPTVGM